MKRKQILFLPLLLLFLLGLGLVAYPIVSSYYTEQHQSQVHTQYQEVVEKADGEELATARAEAEAYNELLASGAAAAELDALDYDSLLNLAGNGIMGYIEIPAIDVLLPIYHGVGEDSLERGAGHKPSTSLPIGGRGTHAVISAHSGMATARMFTDLEQLEAGDVFYLHVLNEALSYEEADHPAFPVRCSSAVRPWAAALSQCQRLVGKAENRAACGGFSEYSDRSSAVRW